MPPFTSLTCSKSSGSFLPQQMSILKQGVLHQKRFISWSTFVGVVLKTWTSSIGHRVHILHQTVEYRQIPMSQDGQCPVFINPEGLHITAEQKG